MLTSINAPSKGDLVPNKLNINPLLSWFLINLYILISDTAQFDKGAGFILFVFVTLKFFIYLFISALQTTWSLCFINKLKSLMNYWSLKIFYFFFISCSLNALLNKTNSS